VSNKATLITGWNSLCLTINNTGQDVNAWINGEIMSLNIGKSIFLNTFSLLDPTLTVGNFSGQMTDLFVWNYPLAVQEIKSFSAGCNQDFPKANAIYWPTVQPRETGKKTKIVSVQANKLCAATMNGKNWQVYIRKSCH
jgi:hypothetical protein